MRNGSAEIKLDAALGPRITTLIRRFQAMGSTAPGGNDSLILDGPAIAQSMAAAPGIASVSLHNTGAAAIGGIINISRIDALASLPAGEEGDAFISYEPAGRLRISLDRRSVPQLLALFSADITGYLSALMVPVVTGEVLTKDEYLMLLASIYGRPLADEMAAGKIDMVIDFPGVITGIQGGAAQGRRARFSLPLIDLLVLETPLMYEARWQ